jgi:hypothetical protein
MPTVLRVGRLRVTIYPNDHRPAHVHVIGSGNEAVFVLNCPRGPCGLRSSHGFSGQALRDIEAALNAALEGLCDDWDRFHGTD